MPLVYDELLTPHKRKLLDQGRLPKNQSGASVLLIRLFRAFGVHWCNGGLIKCICKCKFGFCREEMEASGQKSAVRSSTPPIRSWK